MLCHFIKPKPPTQSVSQPTGSHARDDNTYDNNLAGNNNVDTCITPVYTKDYTMAPGEPQARPTHTWLRAPLYTVPTSVRLCVKGVSPLFCRERRGRCPLTLGRLAESRETWENFIKPLTRKPNIKCTVGPQH